MTLERRHFICHAGVKAFYASRRGGCVICVTLERRRFMCHAGAEAFYVSRRSRGALCLTLERRRLLCHVEAEAFVRWLERTYFLWHVGRRRFMWHTGVEAFYAAFRSGGIFCVKPERRRSPRYVVAEAFFFFSTLGLG